MWRNEEVREFVDWLCEHNAGIRAPETAAIARERYSCLAPFQSDPAAYGRATLAGQFDEYIWFDRTEAVTPLKTETLRGVPDTYPFGL
jgi:erythromycin esterase-like protein